tara:strand:+ start:9070 stop:9531 length:462 start_codon:yes stop_codon:yes gene_type:complete
MGSALRRHGATDEMMPLTQKGTPLKGGYPNHPCTRWVGDSRANFQWAADHAIGLCLQFKARYGKGIKDHFCRTGIEKMYDMADMIPDGELTPFAQAMPDEYKNDDAVKAYRDYYHYKATIMPVEWNRNTPPEWFDMDTWQAPTKPTTILDLIP